MAIDTRDKRSSAVMVAMPWRGQLPAPDGAALNEGDRQQVGLMYRGISSGGGAGPAAGGEYIVIYRRRRRAA
jgi:hypothetical protein